MKRNILAVICLITVFIFGTKAQAQKIDTATVVISGGNAVIIDIPKINTGVDRVITRSTGDNRSYSQVAVLKRASTFAGFRAMVGDTLLMGLKKLKKTSSDKDFWQFINSNPSYKEFSFALLKLNFLKAMGWAYVDNSIAALPANTRIYYKVANAAGSADTGSCVTGKQPNAQKPLIIASRATDSVLFIKWGNKTTTRLFLPYYANIFQKTINGAFVKQPGVVYATRVKDSIYYGTSLRAIPGKEYIFYIQPVDMFNNAIDVRSDTVSLISVNYSHVPAVEKLKASDTTGGVLLSWKKKPASMFLTGVLIQRSGAVNGIYTSLTTVSVTDSTYLDKTVEAGKAYYYRARIAGHNETNEQRNEFSAFASASHLDKHYRPDAPYNLKAEPGVKGLMLKWQYTGTARIAGYYVYRSSGADTTKMELVSRLLTNTTYTDTSKYASQRTNYTYAVKAVSMANIQSSYSAITQGKLPSGIDKPITPAYITVTRHNNTLLIEWQNTGHTDNYIKGYRLYRRKVNPGESLTYDVNKKASTEAAHLNFVSVSVDILSHPYYTDVLADNDDRYEYAVAAVDAVGGESGLSSLAVSTSQPKTVMAPAKLTLIYINNKVELAWQQADLSGVSGYSVYRRALGQKQFKKIATLQPRSMTWTDDSVKPQNIYFYKVKALGNNVETEQFAANTIKIY